MTPSEMSHLHKAVLARLLVRASDTGLTASWTQGTELKIELMESAENASLVVALQEIQGSHPDLVAVLQADPVVRFENAAPVVTIKVTSAVLELIGDGFFDEAFHTEDSNGAL